MFPDIYKGYFSNKALTLEDAYYPEVWGKIGSKVRVDIAIPKLIVCYAERNDSSPGTTIPLTWFVLCRTSVDVEIILLAHYKVRLPL